MDFKSIVYANSTTVAYLRLYLPKYIFYYITKMYLFNRQIKQNY